MAAETATPARSLTPEQLASELGISVGTLSNWRYKNRGPRWFYAGSNVRYRLTDVLNWIEANRAPGS